MIKSVELCDKLFFKKWMKLYTKTLQKIKNAFSIIYVFMVSKYLDQFHDVSK